MQEVVSGFVASGHGERVVRVAEVTWELRCRGTTKGLASSVCCTRELSCKPCSRDTEYVLREERIRRSCGGAEFVLRAKFSVHLPFSLVRGHGNNKLQLQLLFVVFLLGSSVRVPLPDEVNPCGRGVYERAVLGHRLLALAALPAAALLLSVWMAVGRAEAAALVAGAKAEGLASVAGRWRWAALRAALLLAVALCTASCLFPFAASHYSLRYKSGCSVDLATGIVVPAQVLAFVSMATLHCNFAWAAVSSN